ncbi:hypothetical protein AJ78_00586 [Emergomyces pasteurianus Ep9510]|uniref:Mid2 domain-containing protein n=1 Tax=Emergomyces pasteurianus Ep9510 TaxID=1447872 RepID=A0A1J9QU59_9EURO|nr:hypothetical protein AJ78_00586 [Emergomyces pasteurianus Ep9510]
MDLAGGEPIPLTTVFTPPSSCSSSWTYEDVYYNSVTGGLLLQNAFTTRDRNCFPPFFAGTGRGQIQQVFSPGYCPDGYTSPAATTNNGVTTAVCCPSNYSYFTTLTSINFYSEVTIFAGCISTFPASSTTTVLARKGQESLVHSAVTGPITMWGQAVLVQFKSDDLSLFTTASATSSSPTKTASVQTSTTPSPPANNNQPPPTAQPNPLPPAANGNQRPELSTGAKAGIGIGAASAVVILLALVFFIRRSRRNRNSHVPLHPYVIQELDTGAPRSGFWPPKYHTNPVPIHEMPTS